MFHYAFPLLKRLNRLNSSVCGFKTRLAIATGCKYINAFVYSKHMLCVYLFNPHELSYMATMMAVVMYKNSPVNMLCYSVLLNTHVPEQGFTDSRSCGGAVIVIQPLCLHFPEYRSNVLVNNTRNTKYLRIRKMN